MIEFKAEVWIWRSDNGVGWHFVTLPPAARDGVRAEIEGMPRRGFGSVKVRAMIGRSTVETSLFPVKEYDSYLLPLKAKLRKDNGISAGDEITVRLEVL